ncbi:MAG: hypothetical protein WDZ72_13580 [Cyclobacteriaceae bacterium]
MKQENKKLDLILTLDYEMYGDGSGDVFDTMINPTNQYLDFCARFGIKTTIFFEVMEYLKMDEEWENGNKMGYHSNPAKAIRNQLIHAYKQGHDIQLHIHPHWVNARYVDHSWQPDPRYWKLTHVPLEADEHFPLGLKELLKQGKSALEDLLKPVDAEYVCNIFRTGGYSITPSEKIVEVLKELGFVADSSVIPGAFLDNEYYTYDFRNVSDKIPYWRVGEKVEDQHDQLTGQLFEFPIFSKKIKRYKKYDWQRIKIALKNKHSNITKIKDKVEGKTSLIEKFKFFLEDEYLTWDFCLFSTAKMNSFLKSALIARDASEHKEFSPFVLIGHSKEFLEAGHLERFLKKNVYRLNFMTLKQAVDKCQAITIQGIRPDDKIIDSSKKLIASF